MPGPPIASPGITQSPSDCLIASAAFIIFMNQRPGKRTVAITTRPHCRSCCLDLSGVDVRHATISTFKDIKVGQISKSRRRSSEPHNLSAAWANGGPERGVTRVFIAHGRNAPFNAAGNHELMNKQTTCHRIRIFGDEHHLGYLPQGYACNQRIYAGRTDFMRKWKSTDQFPFALINNSGSLAKFAAMCFASSRVNNLADDPQP
jgi:hypothetical protein